MTGRERLMTTLRHQEPDRVPFDLGGTVDTGIHNEAYRHLVKLLGFETNQISICEHLQQIAFVEPLIKDRLKIDTTGIFLTSASKVWDIRPQEEEKYWTFVDPFGVKWGMPKNKGLYFDILQHPLAGTVTLDDILKWPFPDPADPQFINALAQAVETAKSSSNAIVLAACDAGVLERALWLRGFKDFFSDLLVRPSLALALLDRLTEAHIVYWEAILPLVGNAVQVVVEADDLGMQDRLLISPDLYREKIKPRHRRIFRTIQKMTTQEVHIFFHSCGSIKELIVDFIEIGVNILNPIQVSSKNMNTIDLKREFGDALSFWGGGVDTQHVLPHGSPQQVKDEVQRRIEDLAPGGGFVFSAVHNIQADVPPENIMAMWEALQEYGVYC